MHPALSILDLNKRYGNLQALNGVALHIPIGSSLGLAGLNGAGKTSLLRCILNFAQPDTGVIRIFGVDAQDDRARQKIAYVPERFTGPAYLTGFEYLDVQMRLDGLTVNHGQASALAAALDLDPLALPRMLRSYSKGMTQKLGLVTALLAERDLLILDEPMSGLDPKARICLKRELQKHRARGGSLFFTSHALEDIEELCDNIAVLHTGKILYSGTCQALREQTHQQTIVDAFLNTIEYKSCI